MFYKCSNIASLDLSNFKTDKVTDMSFMFKGCSNFKEINIIEFKVNENCDIREIFQGIDKSNCKLIVRDEIVKNLFK